jgi:hypothetical protein
MVVNKREFARLMARSPSAVSKWVSKGLPTTASGGIDFEKGRAWVETHVTGYGSIAYTGLGVTGVSVAVPGGAANGATNGTWTNGAASYADAAREKLVVQTARERVKLERERGVLIPESEFMAVTIGALAWYCAERRVLPARLRDELANQSGPTCEVILARELEACQRELCRRLRVPPSDADDLGAAWLAFYQEWQARPKS